MDLSGVDTEELKGRGQQIIQRLDELFREVGPKIAEIGRLRDEYDMIATALDSRGALDEERKDGK